jgi:hypothetical protein
MKKFVSALAVIPLFISAAAVAQPAQLSESQMDSVSAGFRFFEVDVGNTSWTAVSVWQPRNVINCPACYLEVSNPSLSISSAFGPSALEPTGG